jgi:hypothetical protein
MGKFQKPASRLTITKQREDDKRVPDVLSLEFEPKLPTRVEETFRVPTGERHIVDLCTICR